MRQFILFCICIFLVAEAVEAQDFITRGKIEYEIKRNNKKIYEDEGGHNSSWTMTLPEFDVSYRDVLFSWDRWVYQPGRVGATLSNSITENSVYVDLGAKEIVSKKRFLDDYFIYGDSLPAIKWRIEQETRKIAGWECRKAIGRIHDSVYVVAFYCPEIVTQGGPELFTGLPGMILGLAIPRFYTTWFATKVEIASIDESTIAPPTMKKGKQYKKRELAEILFKKYKDAGWWKDVTVEKVMDDMTGYLLQ
ncbi:MAG: GLPGLI family protein [Niastella sp.]|nr:GLPGLI family protein [Niastella sp.]